MWISLLLWAEISWEPGYRETYSYDVIKVKDAADERLPLAQAQGKAAEVLH